MPAISVRYERIVCVAIVFTTHYDAVKLDFCARLSVLSELIVAS